MWFRLGVNGVAVLGLLAMTGLAPGDSPRVTVEHCYVTYGPQETRSTRCTGHWSRFGAASTGEIHGVHVGTDWRAIPPSPLADGSTEVTIPDSGAVRVRPAVALLTVATVTPWIVWAVRAALIVDSVLWVALLVHVIRSRRRGRVASRD